MVIRKKRGWEIPESAATPEHVFHGRRALLKAAAAGSMLAAAAPFLGAAAAADSDPTPDLYPAKRNHRYVLDRPVTAE
jgi:sulfoxide reductase catalytic subunit YedY